jgi:hypothetical protein
LIVSYVEGLIFMFVEYGVMRMPGPSRPSSWYTTYVPRPRGVFPSSPRRIVSA